MTNKAIMVTKRDGRLEPLNLDKIHRVLNWAAEGLNNVSVSTVELKSKIQFFDGVQTSNIHEVLIKTTADLISEISPDYAIMAARLSVFHLRKIAYSQFEPPHLYDHVKKMVEMGLYDSRLLELYSKDDFDLVNTYIQHDRDMTFSYAGIKQLEGKYLVQNRVTGRVYESPQMLYILIAMCLFSHYPANQRFDYIKRFYNATSTYKISLPTPIMSGVRTPTRQFSSCVLIECDDSLDSINASTSAIVKYAALRAGVGINPGRMRAKNSLIRGGEAKHTGCIPFFKMFESAVHSCSQGGVRKGSATLYYPLWHLDVEELLVLKNNRGVESNRVRHLDYGVQINKLLYTRLIKSQNITLFSPNEVPGLYEAFFANQEEFERLYVQYEQDKNIRKKTIPAVELFSMLMQERAGTGRIYIHNVDHSNTHSPFIPSVAPVRQSNLCLTGETLIHVKNKDTQLEKKVSLKDIVFDKENNWRKFDVLSMNVDNSILEYKPILAAALTKKNAELIRITDEETGYIIECTPEHKVFTKNRGYIEAQFLTETDILIVNKES